MTLPHIESYADLGNYLRHTRQELGVDVAQAAHHLYIRVKYLHALEEGRLADLPGAAYAKGYLTSYAEYLGLDRQAILDLYQQLGESRRLAFYQPETRQQANLPSHWLLIFSFLLLTALYGGWYASRGDRTPPPMVNPPPPRLSYLYKPNTNAFHFARHPCIRGGSGMPVCYYSDTLRLPALTAGREFSTELVWAEKSTSIGMIQYE